MDIDIPFKPKRRQQGVKNEVMERREQLLKVVEKIGFKNARSGVKSWAEHYKTSERSIYRDFKWIKGNFKPTDLQEAKITLSVARDKALNTALDILNETGVSREDKLKAVDTVLKASKHYREEMEAWGDKEKVAEKIEHTGKIFDVRMTIIKPKEKTNGKNSPG